MQRMAERVAAAGENGLKFHEVLGITTKIIEKSTLPLSALKEIDPEEYRVALRQKRWIRNNPWNQPHAPLAQRDHRDAVNTRDPPL